MPNARRLSPLAKRVAFAQADDLMRALSSAGYFFVAASHPGEERADPLVPNKVGPRFSVAGRAPILLGGTDWFRHNGRWPPELDFDVGCEPTQFGLHGVPGIAFSELGPVLQRPPH